MKHQEMIQFSFNLIINQFSLNCLTSESLTHSEIQCIHRENEEKRSLKNIYQKTIHRKLLINKIMKFLGN